MTKSGKVFSYELKEWLIEVCFILSQFQMSIYYKYAPYVTNIAVFSHVDVCFYWYTSEALEFLFVDTLGRIFHMNFMVFAHWFMSIRISQMKDHYILVDQARYATSVVDNYLDTSTFNTVKILIIPLSHLI